jgi:hypothetical protein
VNEHPYADIDYVRSVAGDAEVFRVSAWETHVLLRPVPGSDRRDAAGAPPLVPLGNARDLSAGLDELRCAGAVSVVLVADPVVIPPLDAIDSAFPIRRPFKTHYVVDRTAGAAPFARRHRREIAKASEIYDVRRYDLAAHAAATAELYAAQLARHGAAIAPGQERTQIDALAALPGTCAIGAFRAGALEAAIVFVSDGRSAYSHIAGTSDDARESGAHHACYAAGIDAFAPEIVVDLGGVPGLRDDPAHGLAMFKRGFANAERTAWLLGAVLDEAAYARLSRGRSDAEFFPAYRAGV